MSGVYMIINKVNGKVYVGGTARSIKIRQCQHRADLRGDRHENLHLQRSWKKHGEGAFAFWVLQETAIDDVWTAEQAWLDFFLAAGKGVYNMGPVAASPRLGCTLSDETKRKLKESRKGRKLSDEHKRNISVAGMGRKHTEASKRKIGESHKGKKQSAAHTLRNSMSYPALYNKKTSETIPSGVNCAKLCRERGWSQSPFYRLVNGKARSMRGWVVATGVQQLRLCAIDG